MNINADLLEKVQKENREFRGLYQEHTTLKNKVEALNKKKILTPEQEVEKKKHQKQKLSLKDRMEKILSGYESSIH
jgi:uncharacterized protein YdcH (DUF465 family)